MYEYFHVKVAANASILGGFSLDPEYRNIIDRAAEEGWRYVGFLPVSQSVNGAILEYDLIFEQEENCIGVLTPTPIMTMRRSTLTARNCSPPCPKTAWG